MVSSLVGILPMLGMFSLLPDAHFIKQLSSSAPPTVCLTNEQVFVQAETRDFWIVICGVAFPQFYLLVKKSKQQESLRLPLQDYQNQVYTAIQEANYALGGGIYVYTLTPDLFKISYYGRTVLSQKIVSWQTFD